MMVMVEDIDKLLEGRGGENWESHPLTNLENELLSLRLEEHDRNIRPKFFEEVDEVRDILWRKLKDVDKEKGVDNEGFYVNSKDEPVIKIEGNKAIINSNTCPEVVRPVFREVFCWVNSYIAGVVKHMFNVEFVEYDKYYPVG